VSNLCEELLNMASIFLPELVLPSSLGAGYDRQKYINGVSHFVSENFKVN
jgi:hypothetical protein